jgi:hypothetical protein
VRHLRFAALLALAACGGAPATSSAPAEHRPGSTTAPDECCCIDGDWSSMAFGGPAECAEDGGTCHAEVAEWTEYCVEVAHFQELADQRNAADEACPSGYRHDCDGDDFRRSEDVDDRDPAVH